MDVLTLHTLMPIRKELHRYELIRRNVLSKALLFTVE